ncbi:hypothetical protein CCACVL1_12137 [Corchorus capsularis]|uniref:KIB1-4 beta-propeller domain-containing protein n=1 Tax=Corchorus capsularis TaxID=210143 RepID=A0A1R3IH91_COCAP|nr:hypothetical protein CCACVL1_12137 [Corchorus capsularis]
MAPDHQIVDKETIDQSDQRPLFSLPPFISQAHPCLFLSHGKQGEERQTFFSISQDQYYSRRLPHEMENKRILCTSSFGWLVLMDDINHNYSLVNLDSFAKIQLPCFDFDMDSPDSVLVTATPPRGHIVFIKEHLEKLIFQFCHLGGSDDEEVFTQTFDNIEATCIRSRVVFSGSIFLLKWNWSLLICDIVGSAIQFSELVVQVPWMLSAPRSNCCLIEHLGEMLLVYGHTFHMVSWHYAFNVFRFDFSTRAWVEVMDIGDYAIFIDHEIQQGICCSAPTGGLIRANSIYYEDGEEYCVFDLEERSTTTYLHSPTLTAPICHHKWIMLSTNNH